MLTIEQNTMKAILELRFNPGEGIAYVQSAAKGLSLLCCRSRANNETEEIKERELALNATEQTRQFEDYVKYVKGTVARQPASNYWDLKQNIATYMALLWVLFGDRCDYFINLNKIHAVMDLPEVQQLRQKFYQKYAAEYPGQSSTMVDRFSTQSSPNRILMVMGLYRSLSRFWPVCWRMYVSATQFSGGISR